MRVYASPLPNNSNMTEQDKVHENTTSNNAEEESFTENGQQRKPTAEEEKQKQAKVENDGWILAGTYLIGWLIILVVFKLAYNRYQRQKQVSKKKWYPTHPEKEAYEALITNGEENEEVLRKALLRRAMTDVKRVWELQEEKEALHKLTRSGAIPESMLNSYKDADHDMQLEIFDLQAEAETFKPGWSQTILKESAQLVQRERELHMLRQQIQLEAQARASDPNSSAQEKKMHKKELLKAQTMAEKMINKKYGITGSNSSMESVTDEKGVASGSNSGSPSENESLSSEEDGEK